ncbi:unnamed protein product, partial [Mesorhabditis belari]|uniref:Protein kinase domain-containing protein n=1 Tax=Mesorhabditis belari TaxID=2138241 RepID=A0AAF3ELH4_9BILA
MIIRNLLFLLLFHAFILQILSEFCAVDPGSTPLPPDPADECTSDNWDHLPSLKDRNFTSHYCEVLFLLDLSPDYVTNEEFRMALTPALSSMASQCLKVGVGYAVVAYPMFNRTEETQKACCDEDTCDKQFNSVDHNLWVSRFGNTDNSTDFWKETGTANFSYVFTAELKEIKPCLYNTVILITNRLFEFHSGFLKDFPVALPSASCITLTVVLLGRPDITNESFEKHYENVTTHLLQVNNISCIYEIAHCLPPCGSVAMQECYNNANWSCPYPTFPPSTSTSTTTTTTTTTTPTPSTPVPTSAYSEDFQHLIYIFALSNNTNETEFQNARYFVETPLDDCLTRYNMVVRFLAENDTDSDWMRDPNELSAFFGRLQHETIIIPAHVVQDENETYTLEMFNQAYSLLVNEGAKKERGPKVILMTDFVSMKFVYVLNHPNESIEYASIKWLQQHGVIEVYAFTKEVQTDYETLTQIPTRNLFLDDDFEREKGPEEDICPPPDKDEKDEKKPDTTIWFIIIGVSFGLMVILLVCTVIYRQKLMWMQKLYLFKNKDDSENEFAKGERPERRRSGEEDDLDDIVDFWEITWDHLIVSSEKLGNGAYGLVYKGKMLGSSPGLEHYYPHESGPFRDCDVAVKIIHKHATEKELEMFLKEIDTMKTLGFNEHLVNMLGCSTQSAKRSCLVLEYCANRDLKRYILRRRTELDQSRSIDEQIDCTKEFLHFAWQMTSGMKYLVSRNMIHRDLAARNIMIDSLKNAKIGDFGLCVSANDKIMDASGKLPIKWLAIESLEQRKFSMKSDVWSFGMVLWEMYSMGEIPFSDIEPEALLSALKQGKRPKRPLLATDKLEEVMNRCWAELPNDRPSFDELLTIFTILLEQATEGYGYLQLMANEFYRTLPHIQVEEPDIEEDLSGGRGRSRTASLKSGGMNIIGNMSSMLRAAAQGIGRQFSSGKGVYPTSDHPRIAKKRKSGIVNEATTELSEEGPPRLPMPVGESRRKSGPGDFLTWTGLKKTRRKSFDPEMEKNMQGGSHFNIPRLFPSKKPWKARRKSSHSLPGDLSPKIEVNDHENNHFFADQPVEIARNQMKRPATPPPNRTDHSLALPRLDNAASGDSESEMASLPSSPKASSCDNLSENEV